MVGEEPTALSRKPSLGDVDPDAWKAIPTLVSHGSHKRPGLSAAQIAQPGSILGAPPALPQTPPGGGPREGTGSDPCELWQFCWTDSSGLWWQLDGRGFRSY